MAIGCHWGEFAMVGSLLFCRYYCTWEFYVFPSSIQVTYVQVALLSGKCFGSLGLAVGVCFVCSPQGGSQHTCCVFPLYSPLSQPPVFGCLLCVKCSIGGHLWPRPSPSLNYFHRLPPFNIPNNGTMSPTRSAPATSPL